jgi:hypothetical protein
MNETITPIRRLIEEETHDITYLITEKHTIADIARWIDREGWTADIIYMLNDLEG